MTLTDITVPQYSSAGSFLHESPRMNPSADSQLQLIIGGAGAVTALLLGLGTTWAVKDYNAYIALGPGGPPNNFFGWVIVNIAIRPFFPSEKTWPTCQCCRSGTTSSSHATGPRNYEKACLEPFPECCFQKPWDT
ncbi:hypothetical protein HYQ45_009079 [Verticillium longisporum]|uniref:Uncharacterized protein n=1 Tax=Verticillium longisporum TaxID=100787 RepID=A0A8I2ZLT7_VERLO|nr:hypothetical protein HYQ45_009079 [Verticillium longisporum]